MVTARVGQSCALAVASGASKNVIAAAAFALSMLFLPRVRDALRVACECFCLGVIVFPNSDDFNPR
jgi:hypothetical protein